jgi:hypothetical protein
MKASEFPFLNELFCFVTLIEIELERPNIVLNAVEVAMLPGITIVTTSFQTC